MASLQPVSEPWTRRRHTGCISRTGSMTSPRSPTATWVTCTSRTRGSPRPTRTSSRGWRNTCATRSTPMPTARQANSPEALLWAACHRLRRVNPPEPSPSPLGLFIALEGGDGSGKSTQGRLLCAWLEELGHTVVVTREPGGTEFGRTVRQLVLHGGHVAPRAEALLFAADRAPTPGGPG